MTTRDDHHAHIKQLWQELATAAAGIEPTKIPLEPRPSEINAIREDLERLAALVDPIVQAYGRYVSANVSGRFDQKLFKDVLFNAMDGNALFEIQDAADGLRQEILEAAE